MRWNARIFLKREMTFMNKMVVTGLGTAFRWLGVVLSLSVLGITTMAQSTYRAGTNTSPTDPLEFTGVNLAGGEFGDSKPGTTRTYGVKYIYPSAAEMDYFISKGANIIRFPFKWMDLQSELKQPFNPTVMGQVKRVVTEATGKGLVVILDPHDYARYRSKLIGSPEVSHEAFADFWSRLATQFKLNPQVWFGLMNEPHDMPNEQWLDAANAAIAAIRKVGATNMILVPGNAWTGAHSWISSKNGEVMLKVVDPLNHYIFEVHQYLDKNSSGTKPEAVSATIGTCRSR
jgi:endoglucanase